jgi:hypothetical protein
MDRASLRQGDRRAVIGVDARLQPADPPEADSGSRFQTGQQEREKDECGDDRPAKPRFQRQPVRTENR